MRQLHWNIRRNASDARGRTSVGLGGRFGWWPCLDGPYLQVEVWKWNWSLWYGLPSLEKP